MTSRIIRDSVSIAVSSPAAIALAILSSPYNVVRAGSCHVKKSNHDRACTLIVSGLLPRLLRFVHRIIHIPAAPVHVSIRSAFSGMSRGSNTCTARKSGSVRTSGTCSMIVVSANCSSISVPHSVSSVLQCFSASVFAPARCSNLTGAFSRRNTAAAGPGSGSGQLNDD